MEIPLDLGDAQREAGFVRPAWLKAAIDDWQYSRNLLEQLGARIDGMDASATIVFDFVHAARARVAIR